MKNTILAALLCLTALAANAEQSMLGSFANPHNAKVQIQTYKSAMAENNSEKSDRIGFKVEKSKSGYYRVIASASCQVIAAALSCSTAELCEALEHAKSAGCSKAPVDSKGKKRKAIKQRPAANISAAKPDPRYDPRSYEAGDDFYEGGR